MWTGKVKNGNWHILNSLSNLWMPAQRSDFIRFLRNLCAGMIFLWPLTQTSLNTTALSRDSTLGCSNNWYLGTIELKMANIPENSFKQMFGYWNEAPCLSPVVPRSLGRGSTNPHARFFRWVLTKEKLQSVNGASAGLQFHSVQQDIIFKLCTTSSCLRQRFPPPVFVDATAN